MRNFEIHQKKTGATGFRRVGEFVTIEKAAAAFDLLREQDGSLPAGAGGLYRLMGQDGKQLDAAELKEGKAAKEAPKADPAAVVDKPAAANAR